VAALSVLFPLVRKRPGETVVYDKAGDRIVRGEQFYTPEEGKAFSYPPFFALPYVPLAPLPEKLQRGIWYFINFIFLGLILYLLARQVWPAIQAEPLLITGPPGDPAGRKWWHPVGAIWSNTLASIRRHRPPKLVLWLVVGVLSARFIISPLEYQSHDMIVLLLGALTISAWGSGAQIRSGIWAGLGAACKATPILFILGFLSKLQFKALIACVLAAAAATVLPDLLFPNPHGGLWVVTWYEKFVSKVGVGRAADAEGAWESWNFLNQSLAGTIHRLFTPIADAPPTHINVCIWRLGPAAIKIVTALSQLAIVGFLFLVFWPGHGRGLSRNQLSLQRLGEGAAVLCAMVLLSPMSSKAHFCILLYPITFCAVDFFYRRRSPVVPVAFLLVFLVGTLSAKDLIGIELGNLFLAYGSITFCTLACFLATVYILIRRPGDLRGAMVGATGKGE